MIYRLVEEGDLIVVQAITDWQRHGGRLIQRHGGLLQKNNQE